MAPYEVNIDLSDPNLSHTQVIELVGPDRDVLDVGCADGAVGEVLKTFGCRVVGIERDASMAAIARERLDDLVVADLDGISLLDHFKPATFDVVVLADILEHVLDPQKLLTEAVSLLGPDGRVVVSVPNVAHGSVRLALLQGRWQYTEKGLLDRSHRRFFTYDGLIELLEGSGLVATELRSTVADPLDVEVDVAGGRLPATVVEWVRDQPRALDYQFIARARVAEEGESSSHQRSRPGGRPATMSGSIDAYTQQMRGRAGGPPPDADRSRDHIIGLEAQVASCAGPPGQSRASAQESDCEGSAQSRRRGTPTAAPPQPAKPGIAALFRRNG